jgi:hypothetical protein
VVLDPALITLLGVNLAGFVKLMGYWGIRVRIG